MQFNAIKLASLIWNAVMICFVMLSRPPIPIPPTHTRTHICTQFLNNQLKFSSQSNQLTQFDESLSNRTIGCIEIAYHLIVLWNSINKSSTIWFCVIIYDSLMPNIFQWIDTIWLVCVWVYCHSFSLALSLNDHFCWIGFYIARP